MLSDHVLETFKVLGIRSICNKARWLLNRSLENRDIGAVISQVGLDSLEALQLCATTRWSRAVEFKALAVPLCVGKGFLACVTLEAQLMEVRPLIPAEWPFPEGAFALVWTLILSVDPIVDAVSTKKVFALSTALNRSLNHVLAD